MTEGKSLIPTILKSMLVWVIPMAIGFGFYDQTGKLTTNFWVFKITMVLTLLTITYLCFRKFYKTHSNWIHHCNKCNFGYYCFGWIIQNAFWRLVIPSCTSLSNLRPSCKLPFGQEVY
jgi:membrane protein YdbS with pleckstrin-like domain